MTVDQHIFLNISKYENVRYNEEQQNFDKGNDVNPDELMKEEEKVLVNNNNGMLMANDNEAMS